MADMESITRRLAISTTTSLAQVLRLIARLREAVEGLDAALRASARGDRP